MRIESIRQIAGANAEIGSAIAGARMLAQPVDMATLQRELAGCAGHAEPAA